MGQNRISGDAFSYEENASGRLAERLQLSPAGSVLVGADMHQKHS
jgi:hypothetical protein